MKEWQLLVLIAMTMMVFIFIVSHRFISGDDIYSPRPALERTQPFDSNVGALLNAQTKASDSSSNM